MLSSTKTGALIGAICLISILHQAYPFNVWNVNKNGLQLVSFTTNQCSEGQIFTSPPYPNWILCHVNTSVLFEFDIKFNASVPIESLTLKVKLHPPNTRDETSSFVWSQSGICHENDPVCPANENGERTYHGELDLDVTFAHGGYMIFELSNDEHSLIKAEFGVEYNSDDLINQQRLAAN